MGDTVTLPNGRTFAVVGGDRPAAPAPEKKPAKYRNKRVTVDGVKFDSQAEARRWSELQRLERLGTITGLRRQVTFALVKSVHLEGEKRAKPAIRYVADAVYYQDNATIVEDTKSPSTAKTQAFRMKRHLMKAIHGLDIRLVK